MEDLAATISNFLGSEEGMAQLRSVAQALGLDESALPGGGEKTPDGAALGSTPSPEGGGVDLNTMLLLGRAVSAFQQEDRNTELLRALKPHFSAQRAKKVDDAIRILQLIRLLPLVKDWGILPGGKDGGR